MIEGLWKANNVKINQLNYVNGHLNQSDWTLELHVLSKVNNQYICRIVFHNNINKHESGHEFLILNYDINDNSIKGEDSNSYFTGYLKNDKIHLISHGFEHIKNNKNKFITSYNTTFIKQKNN